MLGKTIFPYLEKARSQGAIAFEGLLENIFSHSQFVYDYEADEEKETSEK